MKKLLYIIFFVCTIVIVGCDKLLDELPPSTLIEDNAITNEASALVALNGIYSYLGANGELVVYQIVDNAVRTRLIEPNIGTLRSNYEMQLFALEVESHWPTLKNLWVSLFQMTNAANLLISKVEEMSEDDFTPGKRNEILSEAKFLRAWATFYQMKMFCQFWDIESAYGPLIRTEPSGLKNNHKARSTVAQGYEQIIMDFEYAAENGPGFTTVYDASNGLSKAYLAEVLLMRGKPEDLTRAVTLTNDVIATSGRTLNTTFAGIYSQKWDSPELMFSRSVYEIDPLEGGGMRPTIYSLLAIGGRNNPTDTYFSYFSPDDNIRRLVIIDTIVTETASYADTWKKHFVADFDVPMRYMRLTQVYLMKAEALARTNASASEVLGPLNVLRTRAGLTPYSTTESYTLADFLQMIFRELIIEVGVENGYEFFAAVRFKDASGNRFIGSINDSYVSDNSLALPIPDDELLFNPLMKQNPY